MLCNIGRAEGEVVWEAERRGEERRGEVMWEAESLHQWRSA